MNTVTIQDIAKAANVSKSTVSRVLNGTATVAEDKKKAVLEATKRLGFQPNIVARSLAKGRSMTIGVLTQLIGSPFYDTVAQGVIIGLRDTGYSPIFVDGQWQKNSEVEAIQALLGRRVDGLVLIGGGVAENEITQLCGSTPAVIVARKLNSESHRTIHMDNVDGGYRATRHMIEKGHQRIAIIKGLGHHPDAIDRFEGYRKAHQEAGLDIDPGLVLEGDFSADSGVAGVDKLLAEKTLFTAVFAANDMTAFGARLALYRKGIRVPGEVSLIGFDDQMEATYSTPPLTTVRQPAREMGQQAAHAVAALIDGEEFESQCVHGELVLRESVAPPPAD
ncbi:MAG: LacI family transcriptional regulator [Planctomycetaceae bacterium]|nr:LacI family transcriptional regulator [Planctomycetaceae bacterium]